MEKGFYHPSVGYWQTVSDPDQKQRASYPEGTIEVPLKPFQYAEWNDDKWVKLPEPEAPVPESITFAQLLIGLVGEGWISVEEGRAWRDRVSLPVQVETLIATLPPEQQFAAETRAMAPSEVLRNDPLVVALGAVSGKTEKELDDFFRKYALV